MSRPAATLLVLGCLLAGCRVRGFDWQYRIDAAIDADARGIRAFPREPLEPDADPCDLESSRQLTAYHFARGAESPVPILELEPGTFGLEIEALDASCVPIGRGCTPVEIPLDEEGEEIVVDVIPAPGEGAVCAGAQVCDDGLCVDP